MSAADEINCEFLSLNNKNQSNSSSPTKSLLDEPLMRTLHRVVLTGGPCAGKTTSINRIRSFFESIGWKVFCVPETATVLLCSGISFYDLGKHTLKFQENLLKTLLQIENTINETAKFYNEVQNKKCLIIYDRGAMDPVAYLSPEDWEIIKEQNPEWNEVELRDNRYDQIIHLITAAYGAESFYTLENNSIRTESIGLAREIDDKLAKVWVGHPYMDVIDNCTEFDKKIARVLQAVCARIGLNFKGIDTSRKRKFLIKVLPDASAFPSHQDFNVVHNYLLSTTNNSQARIRKRGQSNFWVYTYTVRICGENNQTVETRKHVTKREYTMFLKSVDDQHFTVYKLRRCFVWKRRYFQLDIYEEPCNPRCRGLILLETHCNEEDELILPDFLKIETEVTNDPNYSMFNLSLKD